MGKDPSKRTTLDAVILSPALLCSIIGRIRSHVASGGAGTGAGYAATAPPVIALPTSPGEEDYADDFEALSPQCEEGKIDLGVETGDDEYADDLEDSGSEASYEADFEDASDDEEDETGYHRLRPEQLTEAEVRRLLLKELGSDGLAIAEGLGVAAFLEGLG